MDLNADVMAHNKYVHGYGVVCGLKVRCHADRQQVMLESGYALDCEGRPIEVRTPLAFGVVAAAAQREPPVLDAGGNGHVCLTLRRAANTISCFGRQTPQSGWRICGRAAPTSSSRWTPGSIPVDGSK